MGLFPGPPKREDWNSALPEIRSDQNQNSSSLPRGGDQSPILSSGWGPFNQIPASRTGGIEKQGRVGRVKKRKERGKRREVNNISCSFLYSPYKDQTYSHNLHFKITGLARRFNPETVLRQNTLLLYNPKGCREGKKVCPFILLENSRPLSPWGPLDFLSTCLGNDSLIPSFSFRRIMLLREKGHRSSSITASELRRGVVPKLGRQHILLILILRISDLGAPNSSWRKVQQ